MRLIVYGSFLIIYCALIQVSLAENKNYKRTRDNEDDSVERPSKYKEEKKYKSKYRTNIDDESEEDHRINKRHRKAWEEDHDVARENKHSKYSKKANVDPDDSYNKYTMSYDARKDKNSEGSGKRFGKKSKSFVTEERSDEDSNENVAKSKRQFGKDNKEEKKHSKFDTRKLDESTSAEKTAKTKKYPSKKTKDINDDEDSDEEPVKFEKKIVRKTKTLIDDLEESEEEAPKKKFRKKIRVRVPDSPEDDSDESDEDGGGACERKSKRGKGRKTCLAEESVNGGETDDEPARAKKIKYSIKFAHEKEKNIPNEEDNIMLKIHRGDNKKYKYQDDDDDDSSEENTFPKRIHFLDDDEE